MHAPTEDVFSLLPAATIQQHRVVPLALEGSVLQVGCTERLAAGLLRDLAFLTGKQIQPITLDPAEIDAILDMHLAAAATIGAPEPVANSKAEAVPPRPSLPDRPHTVRPTRTGSVVQQVEHLMEEAIEQGASDIHIEPYETFFRVRYRLDGVLHTVHELSLLQRDALISRLKIMASLDIAEKRRPQDGRIRHQHGERLIDMRVSTLPTDFGEKVVLRLLDKSHLRLELDALGFDENSMRAFRRAIHQPFGIILVSGPTGSGKTTTLYAALNELNTPAVNITTIEDPIEYNLPGINQTHVRSDIGFTFAQALRAFLRQDPNIIMVGEIRDTETAEIAVRASLTGHLVLSTIHTNDAPSTITRLGDMGIEPFLIASSLRLTVAQRLVRRICPACKQETPFDATLLEELQLEDPAMPLYAGTGCAACNGTGYQGRTALFEVMPMSEATAELIAQRSPTHVLRRQACLEQVPSLRKVAIDKMRAGMTTPDEVLRETSL